MIFTFELLLGRPTMVATFCFISFVFCRPRSNLRDGLETPHYKYVSQVCMVLGWTRKTDADIPPPLP